MENELKQIMEMLQDMQAEMKQRFDGLEKEIKELRIEVNEFKQVSTEEHNRVVENVDTITQKTAKHARYINYLAGEVGKHSMILNVIDKK
ncbi:hypothetical protein MHB40_22150 [Lysinibacillus sp. FSL K6-0057]|uniref:hypothetical protein n=1 Tax=Lysinibacillus sp. FSL K6-0057 TaxID=2921411 RepID=UPI00315AA689